jgi:oligopeptide/dipeptide ABC transporter ATP-binding protein
VNARALLKVEDLRSWFDTDDGIVKAVDGVSFEVQSGGTLGVVGESGCGKSVTALSIMQLLARPRGRIVDGRIVYERKNGDEVNIATLEPYSPEMRAIRGNEIAMIFQEPMSSLNPVFTVGEQISEAVQLHQGVDRQAGRERAIEMLRRVRIARPEQRVDEYPHQFSGGMRQRAMIAMGLSCDPHLLIADEPTTALDVTIGAQILNLMKDLQAELGMSIMIITHDLGVIGEMADRVIVMYAGKVVESGSTYQIFYQPRHPYTQGLLSSIPQIGRRTRLTPITGSVPSMHALPRGCTFAPRCPHAMDVCTRQEPPELALGEAQTARCWLYKGEPEAGTSGGGHRQQ